MKQPYKDVVEVQEAVDKLHNYLDEIQTLPNILSLFNYEFYFELNSSFPYADFENIETVHAYFAFDPTLDKLSLVFISEKQDEELANVVQKSAQSVIYEAPLISTSSIPIPQNHMVLENPYEMAERWAQDREDWLTEMFNSVDGLTIVSDVPVGDITTHFQQHDELHIFIGLRGADTPETALKLSLLFYDPEHHSFLTQSTDDFSTPKPPFGKKNDQSKYGLLIMAESTVE
jgi:hypothetical protein